jgi:hypothetical protein
MGRFSRSVEAAAETAGVALARFVMMINGVVLLGLGIVMTGSIDMLPAGTVLGTIGIAAFMAGAMFDDGAPRSQ